MKALTLSARLTAAVALMGSGLVLTAPAAQAQDCHPSLPGVARAVDGGGTRFYEDSRCNGNQRPRQYIEARDFCEIHPDAIVCGAPNPRQDEMPLPPKPKPVVLPPVVVHPPTGGVPISGSGYAGYVSVGTLEVIGSGSAGGFGGGYSGTVSVGPISSVGGSTATGTVVVGEVETVAE